MSPPPLHTAEAQLARLLWLIPAASRPGGIALEEAAGTLDVPVAQIQRDVEALTERVFYHPAGTAEGLMIELTDRLKIHTTGQFGRPPRLTPRELFCVVLGLRMSPGDHAALVRKLEERLAFRAPAAAPGSASPSGIASPSTTASPSGSTSPSTTASPSGAAQEPFHIPDLQDAWSADEVLDLLRQGWRARQPVAFGYLKPGEAAPEVRRLYCHGLVHAEGRWYACGHDPEAGGPRNFRVDRILAVRLEGEPGAYHVPDDFDPAELLDGARVFVLPAGASRDHAGGGELPKALVRYGRAVTPWVREQWHGEPDGDGGYRVRHPVGDPGWVIRHVLEYGTEAEILEPAELRDAVRAVAARLTK